MADDDASIQILEPDADQQYVPERKERQRSQKPTQKVADNNWQKPPLLIVERQPPVPPSSTAVSPSTLPTPSVAALVAEEPTRIVNIVDEKPSRVSDIVWIVIRFFAMAFFAFVALVLINPPFVQESQQQTFGESLLQKQSTSLAKAAAWAAGAGALYIILPPIWERFVPEDMIKAFGMK